MRKVTNNGNTLGGRQELQGPLGIYPLSTVIMAPLLSPATSVQVCPLPAPASVSAAPGLALAYWSPFLTSSDLEPDSISFEICFLF